MPTLASKIAEKQAQSRMSDLPSIKIPQFNSDKQAFAYIYKHLQQADKKQLEAILRAMLSTRYYVNGSTVQLNQQGQSLLNNILAQVFTGTVSFSQSYCPDMSVKHYQRNMIEFYDALKKRSSRATVSVEGGRYERGKKVGQLYKITALEIWVLKTNDEVAQLKSWPFAELCAENEKTISPLQVKARTSNTPATNSQPAVPPQVSLKPAAEINWQQFQSKYLPISMQVIGKVKESRRKTGNSITSSMVAQTQKGIFQMSASDYRQKISPSVATATHLKISKSFIKSNKSLIHKKQQLKFGVGTALEYLFEKGSGNNKTQTAYRIFTHGSVIYQLMYSRNKSSFDKKLAKHFFDSVQLK
ncbi:MAG: hypothetical protein QM479_07090 [Pseudomonadota bacterium]